MKKRVRFLWIAGGMFALGILLAVIGAAMGGNLAEASITQDKSNTKAINQTMENTAEIKNLAIDVSASDVTLEEGDKFSIRGYGISKCSVKNGTWHIKSHIKNKFRLFPFFSINSDLMGIFSKKKRELTITIPASQPLDKISLDASAINFKINKLLCKKLEIDASAGSIKADRLECDKAKISLSAGDIKIGSFLIRGEADIDCSMGDIKLGSQETRAANACNKLEAECNMGDIRYYGKLTGENELDVTMGSLKLDLTGTASQYNFSTDTVMGDINQSDAREFSSDPQAVLYGTGDLSCTMGSITVKYHKE